MSLPNFKTPRLVTGPRLWNLLLRFGTECASDGSPGPSDPGFVRLHTDLPAFKKVYAEDVPGAWDAIANLIIPAGAVVYAAHKELEYPGDLDQRKMRASKAKVHSIFTCQPRPKECKKAASRYDRGFTYRPGRTVKPEWGFSEFYSQCAGGIHFFINLRDALDY